MDEKKSIQILKEKLNFDDNSLSKIKIFLNDLLLYNKKYNIISKNTEGTIWSRHALDSAQIIRFIDFTKSYNLADLGTGGGFPGIILAIFNNNSNFHVKLYEKSKIKCNFLSETIEKLKINATVVQGNCQTMKIQADYVVCRAFKKIEKIIQISRETIKKPHKIIILKGKNAQAEINKLPKNLIYEYKLEDSITDKESKIIIFDAK